jgi:hypothetical protein
MANTQITQMDLDFTGVESFSLIPVGIHTVKVKDAEFTKAQTGSDQLAINFEASDGSTRKAWFSLVPQALWKVKQVLEALGVSCEGKIRLNTKTLVGKVCQITVEVDPNDDNRQIVTRVSKVGTTPAVNTTAEGVATTPFVAPATAPTSAMPTTPSTPPVTPISPSNSSPAPQPNPAPAGNLPPWMQNTSSSGSTTPQGNLPPWMRQG